MGVRAEDVYMMREKVKKVHGVLRANCDIFYGRIHLVYSRRDV